MSSAQHIRIATRKSDLALWQANWVKERLESLSHTTEFVLIETQGDKTQAANQAFAQMPGQGFFTKAVQDAVLAKEADVAVHSHKDLPSAPMPGLEIAAISEREDPRDVLLVHPDAFDVESVDLPLKQSAKVGTSAARRQAQLLHLRPDLEVQELRGNVPTRVQKLRDGHYDAIVLAAAGLTRLQLDLSGLEVRFLSPALFVPAPAQGVLALECRRDDFELASVLTELHSVEAYKVVAAERGLMAMLQGGCQLALGAHGVLKNGEIELSAWYEGERVTAKHPSSEGAAFLTYEALGRPAPKMATS